VATAKAAWGDQEGDGGGMVVMVEERRRRWRRMRDIGVVEWRRGIRNGRRRWERSKSTAARWRSRRRGVAGVGGGRRWTSAWPGRRR
jgi:hypothetical protein